MSIPLGIDIGESRVRIAAGEQNRAGEIRIRAIVAGDVTGDTCSMSGSADATIVARVVRDLLREVGTKERRCILGVGAPSAVVRYITFPKMSWAERLRAARFEACRWPGVDIDGEPVTVRVHPVSAGQGLFAVGAAQTRMVERRSVLARTAGLRLTAIDHESAALERVFSDSDAIVDVGAERSTVYGRSHLGPIAATIELGGNHVTRVIARELSIDHAAAEKRKRILGCAGIGVSGYDSLVASLAEAIERIRSRTAIESIALTGNGMRLPGFAADLQRATGVRTELPIPAILETREYPIDMVRVAAPDWAMAAALLSWSAAA